MRRLRMGALRLSRRILLGFLGELGSDVVGVWERKAEGVRGKKVDVREEVGSDEDGDEDEWEDEESEEEGAPQLVPAAATAEGAETG